MDGKHAGGVVHVAAMTVKSEDHRGRLRFRGSRHMHQALTLYTFDHPLASRGLRRKAGNEEGEEAEAGGERFHAVL